MGSGHEKRQMVVRGNMSALAESLRSFGADEETLHAFDSDAPGLLPYASMLTVRAQPNSDLACVDGVFEWQNEPLVFLVASERLQGDVARLNRLRRLIAMRGDAPYLGVFSSGSLQIYNVSLDARTASDALVELDKAKVEKAANSPTTRRQPCCSTGSNWNGRYE